MTQMQSESRDATTLDASGPGLTTEATIAFKGVTRRFGDVTAVDDVSFTVKPGSITGLLGHNGAGKTTIVRLLAGLLTPDSGEVRVLGRDPTAEGGDVRRRLGVLPSSQLVDLRLTARENLLFAATLFGVDLDTAHERTGRLLDELGVDGRADERVGGFSSGMRQRVALARVLVPDPDVLLLDEPSSAMDPVGAQEFRDLLQELASAAGRTVLICTHDLVEADELCDEVIILSSGRILVSGKPRQLVAEITPGQELAIETHPQDASRAGHALLALGIEAEVDRGTFVLPDVTRDEISNVVSALVDDAVRIYAVEPKRPTLADLYFSLHEPTHIEHNLGDRS